MLRWATALVAFFMSVAASLAAQPATGEGKRVALVIGNSNYKHAVALPNPASDAKLMAATLRDAGFEVIDGVDLDNNGMHALLNKFTETSYDADTAVIFYAGHGMQVDGKNFLIPIDAELTSPAHLRTRTIQIDDFIAALPPDPSVGVVILDACRDNPLARSLAASLPKSRSTALGTGLAPVEAKSSGIGTGGILIAYATDPGAVAFDGKGVNSPYTTALAKHLAEPGVEIQSALTRVRGEVTEMTEGRQRPWHNASIGREVFIGGKKPEPAPAPVAAAPAAAGVTTSTPALAIDPPVWEVEQRLWDEASKRNSVAHYELYLDQFPNGRFAAVARLNIDELSKPKDQEVAKLETEPSVANTGSAVRTAVSVPEDAKQVPGTEVTEAALLLDRNGRIDLQLRMEALGHELGSVDGNIGPRTRKAISAWQVQNGMPGTTFLTREQYAFLVVQTDPMMEAVRAKHAADIAAYEKARKANQAAAAKAQTQKKATQKTTTTTKTAQQRKTTTKRQGGGDVVEGRVSGGEAPPRENNLMKDALIFGTGIAIGRALGN